MRIKAAVALTLITALFAVACGGEPKPTYFEICSFHITLPTGAKLVDELESADCYYQWREESDMFSITVERTRPLRRPMVLRQEAFSWVGGASRSIPPDADLFFGELKPLVMDGIRYYETVGRAGPVGRSGPMDEYCDTVLYLRFFEDPDEEDWMYVVTGAVCSEDLPTQWGPVHHALDSFRP